MKNWNFRKLSMALIMVAFLAVGASADAIHNVTATEGPDWVKVHVHGGHGYTVKHLPPGTADYRSIAIDFPNCYIAGGLEPKAALPVDFGLVGQVRVRQMPGMVRVYIDVINWPEYQIMNTGHGVTVAMRAFKQRRKDPDAMY